MSRQAQALLLGDVAIARSGDKGDTATLTVVVLDPHRYAGLQAWLTADRVAAAYAGLFKAEVTAYHLPQLNALHFVMRGALAGGVTRSLALDAHGKTLSSRVLSMPLPVAADDGP